MNRIEKLLPELESTLILGDTLEVIKKMPDSKFDLVVTSPPYNIGKKYEVKKSIENYLAQQEVVITELIRVLSDKGSICWQVGNYIEKGEVFPLDIYYYQIFKKHGLQLRNRIIWRYGHGLHAKKRFSGRYETILWFSKTSDYIFNLDDVRIASKYPGKKKYKGDRSSLSGNPMGKNPSDIWEIVVKGWEEEIWDIPNVKANHIEKTEHPCQFPVELVERCILALTNEGSYILDPYAGVASSLVAAMKTNRNSLGIEKDYEYFKQGNERISQLKSGILKTRPINRPIYVPSPNEKVAQVPKDWLFNGSIY